jgi:Leucine-rich repeat (LRR) protein
MPTNPDYHAPHPPINLAEVDPFSTYLNFKNQAHTSLVGIPSEMPELLIFNCENTPLSLDGFPTHLPKLENFTMDNCRLVTIPPILADIPKLRSIEVPNNALTSLHGLPTVYHNPNPSIRINIRNNLLENLAGLPYILYHTGFTIKGYSSSYTFPHDEVSSPSLFIAGNPFRSLHGVPKQSLFNFIRIFHKWYDPPEVVEPPRQRPSTPEGVFVHFSETGASETPSFFLLTSAGAALLDGCLMENHLYWLPILESPPCMKEDISELETAFRPEIAPFSWRHAHDSLYEYYRLSPYELACQYLAFCTSGVHMTTEMIARLKHEGGATERHLLENDLHIIQGDPVVEAINARLSQFPSNDPRLIVTVQKLGNVRNTSPPLPKSISLTNSEDSKTATILPPQPPLDLTQVSPSIGKLEILSQKFTSLVGLPSEMLNLYSFHCQNTPLISLEGIPTHVPKLQSFTMDNCRLTALPQFLSNFPKLSSVNVPNNALTSLKGLPLVVHDDFFKIDIRNNLFENLAGLPYVHDPTKDPNRFTCPRIYLTGNPLRSLHGVPKQCLFDFIHAFHRWYNLPGVTDTPRRRAVTPEGVLVRYYDLYDSDIPFHFLLTPTGTDLLDACMHENHRFWNSFLYHEDLGELDEIIDDFPKNAPSSWHWAHDALYEYYRLSPYELAFQYIDHCTSSFAMMPEMFTRLIHEGGALERHLLEIKLPDPQEDPAVEAIQTRLSLQLSNGHRLLL